MNVRAAELVAGGTSRMPLAGDQLYVDLDLSVGNLPPGSLLAVGQAALRVSRAPHLGSAKFVERFGAEAMRLVNSRVGRQLRLRGLNASVLVPGAVRLGDMAVKAPDGLAGTRRGTGPAPGGHPAASPPPARPPAPDPGRVSRTQAAGTPCSAGYRAYALGLRPGPDSAGPPWCSNDATVEGSPCLPGALWCWTDTNGRERPADDPPEGSGPSFRDDSPRWDPR